MTKSSRRIRMSRDNLESIPQYSLPEGFRLRWYEPGDERHWLAIHRVADLISTFPPERFDQQFHGDTAELMQRQCYLLDSHDKPIGTATAWYDDVPVGPPEAGFGRVHWVAIVPEAQGQGLARPLMTTILTRLRDLGHTRAYLYTTLDQPIAIHLYERFGFVREPA